MATTSTARQGDLLDALNSNNATPAAREEAEKLLMLWYPVNSKL